MVICFFNIGQNYTLEWFSEAGSAPIRSAVKFYFDIDVRIFFQLLQKYVFDRSKKKFEIFRKSVNFHFFRDFQKSRNFQRKSLLFVFENFDFLKILKIFTRKFPKKKI